jgi:tartrate/fumarate subfamily iron-sulfur-dependent hydro-lyase alpha chain
LRLTVLPKGFGSENCSRLFMLPPSAGRQGVLSSVVCAVSDAGAGACPPLVVGVGVGGTADSCLLAAKRALLRPVGEPNPDPLYGSLEEEILAAVNAADIGPQGLGGLTTALAVHITPLPTHIAALPVGVNMSCHSLRRAGCQLTIGDGGCARPAPPR